MPLLSRENDRERDLVRRERTRDYAVELSKSIRTRESDISELSELRHWRATGGNSNQLLFDTRKYNPSGGLSSNFGGDDKYNVYDKPWRGVQQVSIQEI